MKRAIVTGAGRGIGLAIAQRLAAEGWVVGVLDTNEADVKKLLPTFRAPLLSLPISRNPILLTLLSKLLEKHRTAS